MILSNPFSQKEFTDFINGFLPDFKLDLRKVEVGSSGFSVVLRLGESSLLMTSVLIVRSTKSINSRISLTNNSFKILKTHQIYRALIVYVNEDETIWRLSLLTALPTFDSSGKIILNYSNPRRHSYVLGSDVGIATARKYPTWFKCWRSSPTQGNPRILPIECCGFRRSSRHFSGSAKNSSKAFASLIFPSAYTATTRAPVGVGSKIA